MKHTDCPASEGPFRGFVGWASKCSVRYCELVILHFWSYCKEDGVTECPSCILLLFRGRFRSILVRMHVLSIKYIVFSNAFLK